jgi:hypothetical protein
MNVKQEVKMRYTKFVEIDKMNMCGDVFLGFFDENVQL